MNGVKIDSESWRRTLVKGARGLGVPVTDKQARAMGRHAAELLFWNQTTNLTAIVDPMDVAIKHYVDAIAVVSRIEKAKRVLDAGSGGGFPGIPLKIMRPDLSVTLVDGVRKKVSFLKHAIRILRLDNIEAVHGRLENLAKSAPYQSGFDLVVCRAFSSVEKFALLGIPFLAQGGRLLAMKGPDADNEAFLSSPTIAFGGLSFDLHVDTYRLPILNAERCLIVLTPPCSPK